MPFNKSFDIQSFVNDIPSLAIRRTCWLSLVGSVNANIVAAADTAARKLDDLGYKIDDLRSLEPRELRALMAGPETGPGKDVIDATRKLYKLHVEWLTQLQHATIVSTGRKADDTFGTLAGTISMMTGPQRERQVGDDAVAQLKSLGITVTAAQITAAKREKLSQDNLFAARRKARAGLIEWIIDSQFATTDASDNVYSELDVEMQEHLANKLVVALNKMLTTCINNALFGVTRDDALGVGDHLIISKMLPSLTEQMYSATKPAARKPKPKVNADGTPKSKGKPVRVKVDKVAAAIRATNVHLEDTANTQMRDEMKKLAAAK